MKTGFPSQKLNGTGSALALTMIMTGIALAILGGAMTWSATTTRQTHRAIQYTRSVAAAEAATEKVLSRLSDDFRVGGHRRVTDNLASYSQIVPTTSDSSFWGQWEFNDASGHTGRTFFTKQLAGNGYIVLDSAYSGLRGFATNYTVVSHARDTAAPQSVVAGVLQKVQLSLLPIFQFALFSSGDMEISCGQPFAVTGRVHANGQLYVEPDNILTFESDVTDVGTILFQRHPLDTRPPPTGVAIYQGRKDSHVVALTLPIGTNNTPAAVREIIQLPPTDEDPNSPIGRLRYYNQVDMILVVTNTGIKATSGKFNSFMTVIPTNQLGAFVTTTNSFRDVREGKTVRPIDINIGVLTAWSGTNSNLRVALGSKDLWSVYVWDRRTLAGTDLGAVRVVNGQKLPARGLTVATARPLYVLGHYNQTNSANLGTTNTITTRPASLVADAVTILSKDWTDARSTLAVGSRPAAPTTVNAALLTGVVETTLGQYSGGMENFPRFLETWGGANVLTYNGSMVRMFPSLYATNAWGKADVYIPPARNWAYDVNFDDANKLPPLTPNLVKVIRGQWATVAANQNAVTNAP